MDFSSVISVFARPHTIMSIQVYPWHGKFSTPHPTQCLTHGAPALITYQLIISELAIWTRHSTIVRRSRFTELLSDISAPRITSRHAHYLNLRGRFIESSRSFFVARITNDSSLQLGVVSGSIKRLSEWFNRNPDRDPEPITM